MVDIQPKVWIISALVVLKTKTKTRQPSCPTEYYFSPKLPEVRSIPTVIVETLRQHFQVCN